MGREGGKDLKDPRAAVQRCQVPIWLGRGDRIASPCRGTAEPFSGSKIGDLGEHPLRNLSWEREEHLAASASDWPPQGKDSFQYDAE